MLDSADAGFGTCPCGSRYDERSVVVSMTPSGQTIEFRDVPQGLCPSCGGRVYLLVYLELLEAAFHGRAPEPRV
jgi:YgiT-type zinc finger domain-containing protein